MKRCRTPLVITSTRYCFTPSRMTKIKRWEITSVGKDVEKLEHHALLACWGTGLVPLENSVVVLQNINHMYDLGIPCLCINTQANGKHIFHNTNTHECL